MFWNKPKNWWERWRDFLVNKYQRIRENIKEKRRRERESKEERKRQMEIEVKQIEKEDKEEELATQHVSIGYASSIRFWLVGIAVAYLGYLAFQTLDIIYLVFAALIISMAMEAVIYRFSRWIKR